MIEVIEDVSGRVGARASSALTAAGLHLGGKYRVLVVLERETNTAYAKVVSASGGQVVETDLPNVSRIIKTGQPGRPVTIQFQDQTSIKITPICSCSMGIVGKHTLFGGDKIRRVRVPEEFVG